MSEEKGIKELLELFKGLEVVSEFAGKVLKDKKIAADDLTHLIDLAIKFDVIAEGFKGLSEAKAEAKNLDQAEVVQLVAASYAVVDAFNSAKK